MPKLDFSQSELKAYFKEKVKHVLYDDMVRHAEDMKVHADGVYPKHLIEERRPNEPVEVLEYRQKIFVPKTKPVFHKVIASLSKIRRSTDWSIVHQKDLDSIARILPEETLEQYCEYRFPYFGSLTNWTFQLLLKKYGEDPNALVAVMPLELPADSQTYVRPYPFIYESKDVIEFVQEDFAVIINPLGSTYEIRGKQMKGDSFFVITTQDIWRYDQIDGKGTIAVGWAYPHQLGILPVFRIGAVVIKSEGNNYYHESRLSPMLPELNEAIREYSDLQAAKVLHIYPERYEFTNNECRVCNGAGKVSRIIDNNPCEVTCETCHGVGYIVPGPYSKTIIKPGNNLQQAAIPNPPIGYVQKDTEIVRIQGEGVNEHIYTALSAINFQFLEQTPLNQSGTAKEVDKDELNNTVNAVAEDLVRNMDNVYLVTALYRYGGLYSADEIKLNIVPRVNVPERFDLLSSKHLEDELANAKKSDINSLLKNELELDYASKKFPTNPEIVERLELIFALDPLANVTDDEKMSRLSNKGITLETYIISSNIVEFVQRALDEDEGFSKLKLVDQKEKMKEYAREQMEEQNKETEDNAAANPESETGLDANGNIVDENAELNEPAIAV